MSHQKITLVAKRELKGYFATPLAYIFMITFLCLSAGMSFSLGGFFERDSADMVSFFTFIPWLYLFLMPAIGMRLWAEERKSGAIELLLTLPITTSEAVWGKFLAAWLFATLCLLLTTPLWITVNYLGDPDNGIILTGYIGAFLMAGAFLAICSCLSALTHNQVIAYILGATICFLLMMSGLPLILNIFTGWAPQFVVDTIASLSFLTHFKTMSRGLVTIQSLFFFFSLIGFSLLINTIIIDLKKGS